MKDTKETVKDEAFDKLKKCGIKPSLQRLAIMQYLLTHFTHPTVEDVYQGLCQRIPTLSRTTVYNTLRMFSERKAAQMITIDDHHVCYDGNVEPHVHFFCKHCGRVMDLFDQQPPRMPEPFEIDGCIVEDVQLYYKGICNDCRNNHIH